MTRLTRDEKAELREVFDHYDRDQSGTIERGELRALCEALGGPISDDELAAGLAVIDLDQNGRISFKEFARWWRER
ncbi:EF-hand domain-containing protein [Myxococcota bacterium]|nr:EF-hand domain-containing protein [Myxococcota bacterium]